MLIKLLVLLAVALVQVWADGTVCLPCVNLDAAITMNGKIYLFHKDEVVTLDANRIEDGKFKTNERWPGFPAFVGSGMVWPTAKYKAYFFHGSTMHVLKFGRVDHETYPASTWGSFVARGIDALAFAGNSVYFTKGCKYQSRPIRSHKYSSIKNLRRVNLPCNLDAALTIDKKMIAIKGDKYWSWDGEVMASGPHNVSDLLHLLSWQLCPIKEHQKNKK